MTIPRFEFSKSDFPEIWVPSYNRSVYENQENTAFIYLFQLYISNNHFDGKFTFYIKVLSRSAETTDVEIIFISSFRCSIHKKDLYTQSLLSQIFLYEIKGTG